MDNNNPHRGVQCGGCGDRIFSLSRHDFRWCLCRKTYVDGGRDYLRYGWEDDVGAPKVVDPIIKYTKGDGDAD